MRHTRGCSMNGPSLTSYTILIIDDDSELLELVSDVFASAERRVLVASSGEDGLAMVRTVLPDLILLAYRMPAMNGLAVVERLKADTATRRIPVVALTAGTAEQANELIRAGCIGFIPKP